MLDDVAAVNDARRALLDQPLRAREDFRVRRLAAPAHQHGNAAGDFDHAMVNADIIRRIGLDDVRPELDRLADEREDFFQIAVHHVPARFLVGLEDQGFDHERHAHAVAFRLQAQDVLDALVRDFRLLGNAEQIHHHAHGVQAQRLLDRRLDHAAEERPRQLLAVHVGHIRAQHQRRLGPARQGLQVVRLPDGELDRVRRGGHQRVDAFFQVFNPLQEPALIEEPVVHGHVEAAVGAGVEEPVQTIHFHKRCVAVAPS